MHAFERALGGIGRRLIGGFRTRKGSPTAGKHMPHQGDKEKARRRRQMAKGRGE